MRNEVVRLRALRSAMRITFTLGLGGCIQDPGTGFEADDDPRDDGGDLEPDADAPDPFVVGPDAALSDAALADAVAIVGPDARVGDAFVDSGDAAADAETPVDAAAACPKPEEDPEGWERCCETQGIVACCEAVNWDWQRAPACMAWGPPVPPAMEVA